MQSEESTKLMDALKRAFHPSFVSWVQDGEAKKISGVLKAPATAIANILAYHNRLDEVCGLDWSVTYTPWGERIVCHLTVNGVTRSSVGSETPIENAEVRAFKLACAMFGIGRYLQNVQTVWVECDESGRFTETAKARLDGILVAHYRRHLAEETRSK